MTCNITGTDSTNENKMLAHPYYSVYGLLLTLVILRIIYSIVYGYSLTGKVANADNFGPVVVHRVYVIYIMLSISISVSLKPDRMTAQTIAQPNCHSKGSKGLKPIAGYVTEELKDECVCGHSNHQIGHHTRYQIYPLW